MEASEPGVYSGVIWITGFSASGKTTVGRQVCSLLRQAGMRVLFMDGDDLRSIFANRWGYDRQERIDLAHVYFRLCNHIASQGNIVVISAVAMYDEIRDWVKQNVPRSIEVFLDVPEEIRLERDANTKNVYSALTSTNSTYDAPTIPDMTILNHGEILPENAARRIVDFFTEAKFGAADLGRTDHWNNYYNDAPGVLRPSPFAEFVNSRIDSPCRIVEVGCGNGRDSSYFSAGGHRVTGIDVSKAAIDLCNSRHKSGSLDFFGMSLSDLARLHGIATTDVIYSRFVLHAMPLQEEIATLEAARHLLGPGGRIFIECRSINDPLARLGEVLSPTERIYGHYRRFIVLAELEARLQAAGFEIAHAIEGNGLAVHGGEDPVVIRVEARV